LRKDLQVRDPGNPAPVFILLGPTASGKTALLEELFDPALSPAPVEIISADSMQVYRGMDIGTAKPDPALRNRIPHHLIDIRDPSEQFNAGDFVRLAHRACGEIRSRSRLPVISGGTGFYLRSFIFGLSPAPPSNGALRGALKEELAQKGPGPLFEELGRRDPESARRIHINDTYRLLRALEVCRSSGLPLSSFSPPAAPRSGYRFLIVGIRRPRNELYRLVAARCDDMFRRGLYGEVRGLFQRGYTPRDPGLRAIGYREFFIETQSGYEISGDIPGVKNLVERNSRHYVKRQETFFSSIPQVVWVSVATGRKTLDLLRGLIHTFVNSVAYKEI
jgi:tRNA dimethylallyltransferase